MILIQNRVNWLENKISFLTGDILVMIAAWIHLSNLLDIGIKVFCTISLGIIGGAAGLFGKDLYNYFKSKIYAKIRNRPGK